MWNCELICANHDVTIISTYMMIIGGASKWML